MAKNTTNKSKKRDETPGKALLEDAEAAFEHGSYAGVRRLALSAPSDASDEIKSELARLRATVDVDPAQFAVGVAAVVIVVLVGFLTLHM